MSLSEGYFLHCSPFSRIYLRLTEILKAAKAETLGLPTLCKSMSARKENSATTWSEMAKIMDNFYGHQKQTRISMAAYNPGKRLLQYVS
jgi:hypothetical protein